MRSHGLVTVMTLSALSFALMACKPQPYQGEEHPVRTQAQRNVTSCENTKKLPCVRQGKPGFWVVKAHQGETILPACTTSNGALPCVVAQKPTRSGVSTATVFYYTDESPLDQSECSPDGTDGCHTIRAIRESFRLNRDDVSRETSMINCEVTT